MDQRAIEISHKANELVKLCKLIDCIGFSTDVFGKVHIHISEASFRELFSGEEIELEYRPFMTYDKISFMTGIAEFFALVEQEKPESNIKTIVL